MIVARTIGGPAYPEMIEEMDRELTNVIEDFDRAMNLESLRLANEASKLLFLNLSIVDPQGFGVEHAEQERVGRERVEQMRVEQERAERERAEREQVERERVEREQVNRERAERERERMERERMERERMEREQ